MLLQRYTELTLRFRSFVSAQNVLGMTWVRHTLYKGGTPHANAILVLKKCVLASRHFGCCDNESCLTDRITFRPTDITTEYFFAAKSPLTNPSNT